MFLSLAHRPFSILPARSSPIPRCVLSLTVHELKFTFFVLPSYQTVQGNAEECEVLKEHVGHLLPVVLAAMEEESKRPGLAVPSNLKQGVRQFHK